MKNKIHMHMNGYIHIRTNVVYCIMKNIDFVPLLVVVVMAVVVVVVVVVATGGCVS